MENNASVGEPETSIAIVIPAFQEAATIAGILERCRRACPDAGLLVVDDGSTDGTGDIARSTGAIVLRQAMNSGKGTSLAVGLRHALASGATGIVTLDADGQHRPEDLSRLLACATAWPDRIVIGSRRAGRAAAPRGRRISNQVADFWVSWAAGWPVEDSQSGFRVYPAALLARIRFPTVPGFAWESEILIEAGRHGVRTVAVEIPTIYGPVLKRKSHFRPVHDITRIVIVVGGHLLRRGMHPAGLIRSLRKARGPAR